MTAYDDEQREEILLDAMAEYDEALAKGVATDKIGTTISIVDPELAAEWNSVKHCLNRLDQARQRQTDISKPGATPSVPDAPAQQRTIGRFNIERELGRGGLGIVYLARDPKLHREVALKIPKLEAFFDGELRRRFLREAKFAAQLNHPNLTVLYEAGEDNTCCYIATEYCRGPTLAEWIRKFPHGVPVRDAAEIMLAIARGVEHAHSRTILHRDIKPTNVLMSTAGQPDDDNGPLIPKLTDFGVAKFLQQHSSSDTQAGLVIGTLAYIAPEQLTNPGAELDARTDIYGLGATLYELLAGRAPYGDVTDLEKLRSLIATDPTPPRKIRADVPADLEAIVLKCMAKDRRHRYSTAAELVCDLQRFLAGRPTIARPTGIYGTSAKWLRRQPILAATAALCILTAAALVWLLATHRSEILRSAAQLASLETRADQEQSLADRFGYISQMQKVRQAWHDGDLDQMRKILDSYNDGTRDAGLRRFEWYYLNHLANLPHLTLKGHVGEIYTVAFSPDGQTVLTGGEDGTVRLWDPTSSASLAVLQEHASCVNRIKFAADGDMFATCSCDKTIKLWSLRQRKALSTLAGHSQEVDICDFVDDGTSLVSLSRYTTGPREVRMWDIATGATRTDWPPKGKYDAFTAAHLGRTILTYSNNRAAVWIKNNDQWKRAAFTGPLTPSTDAVISPDERYLLIPRHPNVLETRRLRDGKLVSEISQHADRVNGIAVSNSANKIATAASDKSVRVFDLATGQLEHCFLGHHERVWQVAWSPNEEMIASASSDGIVYVWNLRYGSDHIHLQPSVNAKKNEAAQDVAFFKDGHHLNAIYSNGDSLIWDLTNPQTAPVSQLAAESLATKPAEEERFSAAVYSRLTDWDSAGTFTPPRLHRDFGGWPDFSTSCVRMIPSQQHILEIRGGNLLVRDLRTRSKLNEHELPQPQRMQTYFDIAPDGKNCCGLRDRRFFVCALDGDRCEEIGGRGGATWALFSPDSQRVLIVNNSVFEYDARTTQLVREYPVSRPSTASYSSDGERIAIASGLGFVAIFDSVTGQEILRLDGIGDPAFSPDGRSLIAKDPTDGGLNYWPGRAK